MTRTNSEYGRVWYPLWYPGAAGTPAGTPLIGSAHDSRQVERRAGRRRSARSRRQARTSRRSGATRTARQFCAGSDALGRARRRWRLAQAKKGRAAEGWLDERTAQVIAAEKVAEVEHERVVEEQAAARADAPAFRKVALEWLAWKRDVKAQRRRRSSATRRCCAMPAVATAAAAASQGPDHGRLCGAGGRRDRPQSRRDVPAPARAPKA